MTEPRSENGAGRFDGRPLTGDPEHADLGYFISEPLPYYPQRKPRLLTRLAVLTIFRGDKCCYRWCSWPATERGFVCDRHGPQSGSQGVDR